VVLLRIVARFALAIVFLAAGASKLLELAPFADKLTLHSGLAPEAARAVAAFLPWLELICGLCLALGYAVREAAAILAVLLVLFLGYSFLHRTDGDCGCFVLPQWSETTHWGWLAARNVALLLCALLVTACCSDSVEGKGY
jgi:uncharacterized membrane protein YphA (DoxX/SURF4 family)